MGLVPPVFPAFPSPIPHLQSGFRPMDTARIAELLKPFLGPQDQTANAQHLLTSISTYIDILLRWNARINLTAIRDPEDIVTRHFGESLFAARHLFPMPSPVPPVVKGVGFAVSVTDPSSQGSTHPADHPHAGGSPGGGPGGSHGGSAGASTSGRAALQGRVTGNKEIGALAPVPVADVGSGAGFPGLPIKLWAPHISLTLIESNHKKAAFLREVTRALTLTDVNIQNARAESLHSGSYDTVTLRAVERFESILPIAAALVAPGGRLALLISSAQQSDASSALPNLAWSDPAPVPQSRSRILLMARRPMET